MSESNPMYPQASGKKILISAVIGNMLEIYDFALYGYFAPIISTLFFPRSDKFMSLLATFGIFAMGFLMRPIGAILFGYFGDRIGRKKTLSASILLMAIPTTLIGLLPTYAQIGMLAGILLLCCRLLQGLATGGEFAGAIIYVTEHAPDHRRGFHGSLAIVSTFIGFLVGSGVSALFSSIISPEGLSAWGWRIPFIMGFILGFIGLYLRLRMPETPGFIAMQVEKRIVKNPVSSAFKDGWKQMLIIGGLNSLPATSYYLTFVYLSSYFVIYLKLSMSSALTLNTISMIVLSLITPYLGFLSDKIGRKTILLMGAIGLLIFAYPLFLLMHQGGFGFILAAQLGLTLFIACLFSAMPATIVEIVPSHIRYTAVSFPYNLSSALFGGVFPLVATFLIGMTGNLMSPSFCLIFMASVMIVSIYFVKRNCMQSFMTNLQHLKQE